MTNKEILMKFISAQQQKSQPIVTDQGYKAGAPPEGSNWRIPSDMLYNPTPFNIKAVSDNGIEKTLKPFDTTNVEFPGAQYVDEYHMKHGGLHKFLPKAQDAGNVIPADADRYGINNPVAKGDDTQYVDPALFQQLQELQNRINPLAQSNAASRQEYEKKVLEAINRIEPQNYDVTTSGYIPESVRQSEDVKKNGLNGCISGVCYTLNEAGDPVRYYSNSMFQDAIKDGTEKNWALDFDTKNISGGDIVQFTGDHEGPHHGALVVPNTIVHNEDGTITFEAFMNSGDGPMYKKSYTVNPKDDRVDNMGNDVIQLIKRKNVSDLDNLVSQRDQLKAQIEAADPAAFKKGRARRWNTYMPGAFREIGVDYTNFEGQDPLRMEAGSMMQNLKLEDAGKLLTKNTINYDIDYEALRKSAGFENILNQINDPEFKMNFMKDMNITNREYNAVVSHAFGIYGQETGFGTKANSIKETDAARKADSVFGDIWSRINGEGAFRRDVDEDYSRGLTQVQLRNLKGQDRRQYGINKESIESDPTKAFLAAMIANAQNLPELRKLVEKGETNALTKDNYLDFLPYLYNQPYRIRRGDMGVMLDALAEGESPFQALVRDPNSPMANNAYLKNVRTYSDLFRFIPLAADARTKKMGGDLGKFQKGGEQGMDWEAINNIELAAKAKAMGHDSIASYRDANWGYGPNAKKGAIPEFAKERLYQYMSEKKDSVFDNRIEGIKRNDENFLKNVEPEKSFIETVKDIATHKAEFEPERINLSKGRFNLGSVSTATVDKLVAAAKRQGVDPYVMLGLAGRESTFGKGYGRGEEDLRSLVSGWTVAEPFLPYDLNRFLADKKVPGVSTSKNFHGWDFKAEDMDAINKHLQAHPELINQYLSKIRKTAEIGDLNTLDMAARKIKKEGIAAYNPGDTRYEQMFRDDMMQIKQDPELIKYLQSKGIKANGGAINKYQKAGTVKQSDEATPTFGGEQPQFLRQAGPTIDNLRRFMGTDKISMYDPSANPEPGNMSQDQQANSPVGSLIELLDPSGIMSHDDAKKAYHDWKASGSSMPTMDQALSMFSAIPALGKYGKFSYLAGTGADGMKALYKSFPWQQALNIWEMQSESQPDYRANGGSILANNMKKYQGAGTVTPSLWSEAMEQLQYLQENPETWKDDPDMQGPGGKLNLCLDCINVDWKNPEHIKDAYRLIEQGYSMGTHYNEEAFHQGLQTLGLQPPVYNSKPAGAAGATMKALGGPIADYDVYNVPHFMMGGGEMIRRADGSYSQRGLWDNIRANAGSGKKPSKEMLQQERKIEAMRNGGTPCFECGGKYAEGGMADCPDGMVPDANGNCVDDLSTPPLPNSSLYSYYQQSLNKYGPSVAAKMVSSKRHCNPGDECWDEPEPSKSVQRYQDDTENYTLQDSGNPGVAYLHYKKNNGDGTYASKQLGATLVSDWLDNEQQKQFYSTHGGSAQVNFNPNVKMYTDVKDATTIVENFRKAEKEKQKQMLQQKANGGDIMPFEDLDKDPKVKKGRTLFGRPYQIVETEAGPTASGYERPGETTRVKTVYYKNGNVAKQIIDNNEYGGDETTWHDKDGKVTAAENSMGYRTFSNGYFDYVNNVDFEASKRRQDETQFFDYGNKLDAFIKRAKLNMENMSSDGSQPGDSYNTTWKDWENSKSDYTREKVPGVRKSTAKFAPGGLYDGEHSDQYKEGDYQLDTTTSHTLNDLNNNGWNRGLAAANTMGDPNSMVWALPNKGFGSGLKAVAGLAAGLSGAVLGYEKMFNNKETNNSTMYNSNTGEYGKTPDVLKARWDATQPKPKPIVNPVKSSMTPTAGSGMGAMEMNNNYEFEQPVVQPQPGLNQQRHGGMMKFWGGGPYDQNLEDLITPGGGNGTGNSQNPNNKMQQQWQTKQYGDSAGFIAANNALNGLGMMNDVLEAKDYEKQYNKHLRDMGNTDAMYNSSNPVNPFGSYTPNVGPGSNYSLVTNGFAQDFGTKGVAAKYGGTKQYRQGGTYHVSQDELMYILANGGEIEYL